MSVILLLLTIARWMRNAVRLYVGGGSVTSRMRSTQSAWREYAEAALAFQAAAVRLRAARRDLTNALAFKRCQPTFATSHEPFAGLPNAADSERRSHPSDQQENKY